MTHWWRVYDEVIDDPKVQGLSDSTFRFWFNVLCVASRYDGKLPDKATLTYCVRGRLDHVERRLNELINRGLVDEIDGRLEPHNWRKRQYNSGFSKTGTKVAKLKTDTDKTDTETEKKEKNARARERPSEVEVLNNDFEEFWKIYPHKVGRKAAQKAFATAMKSGSVNYDRLMFGLAAYVSKTDDRPWCNPATWLNQGRWDDKPAEDPRNGRSALAAADRLIEKFGGVDAAKSYVPGSGGPAALRLDFGENPPSPKRISSR